MWHSPFYISFVFVVLFPLWIITCHGTMVVLMRLGVFCPNAFLLFMAAKDTALVRVLVILGVFGMCKYQLKSFKCFEPLST